MFDRTGLDELATQPVHTQYGDAVLGERGNTRCPAFGEWIRGVWTDVSNPQRDGMYVETIRRPRGRANPGTWFRLTNGIGVFWEYEAKSTVFLNYSPESVITAQDRRIRALVEAGDLLDWNLTHGCQQYDEDITTWRLIAHR